MAGLTWLHLSDWHQGGTEFDRQVVLSALLKDIRERAKISPDLEKIDFVIFSGDVAFSGKPDQYQAAKEQLFQPLLDACRLNSSQLFIVPGNHDLDMDEFKMLPGELSKPLTSEAEVQSWLTDNRRRSRLLEPFQAFAGFVKDCTGQEQPDYANVRRWQIGDKKIAVLGLNSAWMCGRNKIDGKISDKGFVLVGEPQIQNYIDGIADADLRIAVLHHPFDWLAEFDCNRIEGRLKQGFDFILRGHQHKQKVEVIHGTSGDSVIIPAGASYNRRIAENPAYVNSYNFVHLDFDSGKGIVFLRRWSDPRTEWIEDIDSFDGGEFEFRLFKPTSETSTPLESIPSSTPIIPHQLPSPPRDFKGREDEIKDILSNFEKGATITGLRGMGGIGKTALAIVLANELIDRFPDGQLFINLLGTSPKPLTPGEAMAHVILSYHPTRKIPEDLNGLEGLYRSVLAGKHVLLLLDNASGREQVDSLLPPSECAVLITSRNRFALSGLKEKDLDVLPLPDAIKLLLEIDGRIGDHAEELAELCGRLPLAMRNAAYALAERRNLSVYDYLQRLKDSRKLLEMVDASFSLSYELLPSIRKKQWRLLSIFPKDFDCNGAAAVWKMGPEPSEEAISDLVKWSLVEFIHPIDSEEGYYRLHDLARLYAESRLETGELAEAKKSQAKHYMKVLSRADKLYDKGGENISKGLELFDREWMNIKAGQNWAEGIIRNAGKKKNDEGFKLALHLAASYPNEGRHLLELRLHPLDRIGWLETGLTAARMMGETSYEGAALANLGGAYDQLSETRKAIEYYEQALRILRKIRDREGEGATLANLGLAYSNLGEARKAIEYYEQALRILRKIRDRGGEGTALANLGESYSVLGETRKAIYYYDQALVISREIGDKRSEGSWLGSLGNVYYYSGETRKAIYYYDQALVISREIGDKRNEGVWLGNLGNAYFVLGETRKAIEYHHHALAICREIGDRRNEASDLSGLGTAYSDLGETRKAIEYYNHALAISLEIGDRRSEGLYLGNLGTAHSDFGETRKAIEYYNHALAISREIEDRLMEGEELCNLGKSYSDINETNKAVEFCMQSLDISHKIENKKIEGEALCNLGKVNADLGENDTAIDYCDQALEIFQKMEYRRGEGNALLYKSLALDKLGQRQQAIDSAKAALDIFEKIESPRAEKVRQKLVEWQSSGEPEN